MNYPVCMVHESLQYTVDTVCQNKFNLEDKNPTALKKLTWCEINWLLIKSLFRIFIYFRTLMLCRQIVEFVNTNENILNKNGSKKLKKAIK